MAKLDPRNGGIVRHACLEIFDLALGTFDVARECENANVEAACGEIVGMFGEVRLESREGLLLAMQSNKLLGALDRTLRGARRRGEKKSADK